MINTNFPIYKTFIFLSIFLNIILIISLLSKKGYSKKDIIIVLIYEVIGIILGGKFISFLLSDNLEFNFINQGLSSFGALIGVYASIYLYSLVNKKSFMDLFNIFSLGIPLMYAVGKIGCFLVGCCYGIEWNYLFKIMYHYSYNAPNDVYLFPVQLFEAITFALIFIINLIKYLKNVSVYKISSSIFFFCGFWKLIYSFFRYNESNFLTFNKVLSIGLIIIGIIIYFKNEEEENERRN